jgi:hypothetical protein
LSGRQGDYSTSFFDGRHNTPKAPGIEGEEPEKYNYSVIDKDQGIYKKDQAEILQV